MSKYHNITDIISDVAQVAIFRIRRNPVLVGAAGLWAYEFATTQDALTWQGIVTIVAGFLVRSKTVPANEVWDMSDKLDEVLGDVLGGAHDALEEGIGPDEDDPTLF